MLTFFPASIRLLALPLLLGICLNQGNCLYAQDSLVAPEIALSLGDLEGDTSTVHRLLKQANEALKEQHNNELADSLAEIAVGLSQKLSYYPGEAEAILLRGKVWLRQRKYHPGLQAGRAAMDIFASLQDSSGYYQAQVLEGTCLYGKGEVEAGRLSLLEAVDGLRAVGATYHVAVALNNLGALYKNRGEYTHAIEMLREAATLMEEVGEIEAQGSIYNNIGSCYVNAGARDAAREYYVKALQIFQDHEYEVKAAGALVNLGNWYRTEERYDSALLVLEEAEAIFMNHQLDMDIAIAWFNQALVFDKQDQRELALIYLDKSSPIFEAYNSVAFKIRSHLLRAQIQLQQHQPEPAMISAQKAKTIAEAQNYMAYQPLAWELIGDSYRAMQQFEKSLDAYLVSEQLRDSIDAKKQQEILLRIKAEDDRLEKEQEIQELQEVVSLREKLVTQQNRVIQFQLVGLGLFIVLCVLLFIYYRQKNQLNQQLESLVRKRTRELETTNLQLTDSIRELQQFNRIVSHDLKEPLRNINGFLGLLSKALESDPRPELKEYLDFASGANRQMVHLLADIRSYIKIREAEVEWGWCDLEGLVAQLLEKHQAFIIEKDAYVEIGSLPHILADNFLLTSALEQLLINAVTYSDSQPLVVQLTYKQEGNHHLLLVEDNGFGISESYQTQIFEMFKRLNDRRRYKGSGLGLPIAQRSMEKMHGQVELLHSSELGSIFCLKLPILPSPPA